MSKMSDLDLQEDEVKVILIGEMQVGKTNLINIAMGSAFNENEESTGASTFSLKKISVMGKEYGIKLFGTNFEMIGYGGGLISNINKYNLLGFIV